MTRRSAKVSGPTCEGLVCRSSDWRPFRSGQPAIRRWDLVVNVVNDAINRLDVLVVSFNKQMTNFCGYLSARSGIDDTTAGPQRLVVT